MCFQWSGDTLHKQDAFRCHQQSSLHIARLLTGTLTLVVASHEIEITINVQIFNLFLFAIGGYLSAKYSLMVFMQESG